MRNGLLRRSQFPDKMKKLICFQQIKFLYSICKI